MTVTPEYEQFCEQGRNLLREAAFCDAIEAFEQARALDDEEPELFENLATAYFLAGDYESAIQAFQRVIDLDPRRGSAYINMGATYNRLGDFPKAAQVLQKGVKLERRSAEGYYNLGIAHRRMNRPDLAIPAYREAIRLAPQMVEAHQNLGNVYFDQGHYEQAVAEFRRALEIDPSFVAAQKRLLQAEEAAKLHKLEISPFGRLVAAPPEDEVRHYRELTDEEREADRAALATILAGVHEATRALIAQLRTKLDPGVREFDRAMVDHARSRSMLTEARQEFRHVANAFRTLHREMNRHIKHLHDHEQSMELPPERDGDS